MAASIIPAMNINTGLILNYIMWGFLIFVLTFILSIGLIMFLVNKKSTKFIELNLLTKKFQEFSGKYKKQKSGMRLLWARKIKKYLPNVQQESVFTTKKGKDLVMLIKDNNGLHHTAKLPNHDELVKWYSEVHNIDIEETETEQDKDGNEISILKYSKLHSALKTIYLLPSPSEDLNWLGTQCTEAELEFVDSWWKHPSTMIIATVAICGFIFIISLIVTAKMT